MLASVDENMRWKELIAKLTSLAKIKNGKKKQDWTGSGETNEIKTFSLLKWSSLSFALKERTTQMERKSSRAGG